MMRAAKLARHWAWREKPLREQAAHDWARSGQPSREQAAHDWAWREKPSREQAARHWVRSGQPSREQAAHDWAWRMRAICSWALRWSKRAVAMALLCALLMTARAAQAELSAYFIDVGQGDGCIISCDGEHMLVDAGPVDSGERMAALLESLGISSLKYVINTHPHSDHAGGLSAALEVVTAGAAYSSATEYPEQAFNDYVQAVAAQGLELATLSAGDELALGGAQVSVLAPASELESVNDNSIVLRITYGDTALLMMGDAGEEEEQALLDSGAELQADLIKVGHHGSSGSTSAALLERVSPAWAIISVGTGNDFGHPHAATLERLSEAGAQVLRTDMCGDLIAFSDGVTLSMIDAPWDDVTTTSARGVLGGSGATGNGDTADGATDSGDSETNGTAAGVNSANYYIGNVNTHKFHLPSCGTLPAEENRIVLVSRAQAIAAGYSPCGNCDP